MAAATGIGDDHDMKSAWGMVVRAIRWFFTEVPAHEFENDDERARWSIR